MKIGDRIIHFSLKGVDGKVWNTADFEGKPIAVIFWCNHCPYVKAWEDRIIKLQKEFPEVQFFLVNSNDPEKYPDDSPENMKKRAEEKGYPFPYLFDETQEVARKYGAQRTPEIFLFDKEGKLVYHGAPDDNWEDESKVKNPWFREALKAVLEGRTPKVQQTHPVGCTIKWRN